MLSRPGPTPTPVLSTAGILACVSVNADNSLDCCREELTAEEGNGTGGGAIKSVVDVKVAMLRRLYGDGGTEFRSGAMLV